VNQLLPILEVQGPEGESFIFPLSKDRLTVGRFRELNEIGLEPDPQQLITRKAHCIIERDADKWWVVDNGSANKTYVRRAEEMEIVDGRAAIGDGDAVLILGRLTENNEPIYWELTFRDPLRTHRIIDSGSAIASLEYDRIQARLFFVDGARRQEITNLRPQEHKLIRYMDQRNRENGDVSVMCTHDELIKAIWGNEVNHTEAEINHLIYELRQKLEVEPKTPKFFEAVRGMGYRLVTRQAKV
jgi:hypothetical protein